jgi:hypothetical protein
MAKGEPPLTLLMLAFSLQISPNNEPLFFNLIPNVSLPPSVFINKNIERKNTVIRFSSFTFLSAHQPKYNQRIVTYTLYVAISKPKSWFYVCVRWTSIRTLSDYFGTFSSCFGLFPSWQSTLSPKVRPAIIILLIPRPKFIGKVSMTPRIK